jgi:hypothetical protein
LHKKKQKYNYSRASSIKSIPDSAVVLATLPLEPTVESNKDLAPVTSKFKDFGSVPAEHSSSPFGEAQTGKAAEAIDFMQTRYLSPANGEKKEEAFVLVAHTDTEALSPK